MRATLRRCVRLQCDAARVSADHARHCHPDECTWQAVAIETEIRKSGIALSEQEYTMLVTAMTGCARNSSLRS
jgi:hypothetical protein